MIANKVLLRDAQQNKDSLQSSLTALEEELRVMKSDALARNTEEVERSLSQEVSLRQKMQLEFECCSRLFSEEKLALTLRCDELVHTLETADSDRFRFIYSPNLDWIEIGNNPFCFEQGKGTKQNWNVSSDATVAGSWSAVWWIVTGNLLLYLIWFLNLIMLIELID